MTERRNRDVQPLRLYISVPARLAKLKFVTLKSEDRATTLTLKNC